MFDRKILSAEHLAVVKLATVMCNSPALKRDILCAVGSECFYETENSGFNRKTHEYHSKIKIWNDTIERKSKTILKSVGFPEKLQDKLTGSILTIGRKMLTWTKYHEKTLGFSSEDATQFLNIRSFTQEGTIDNKKVFEELMNEENLSVKQKYVLACLHYRTDFITSLYNEMKEQYRNEFCDDKKLKFIKYLTSWTSGLIRMNETLNIDERVEYAIDEAVACGSLKAVKDVLEFTDRRGNYDYVVLHIAKKAFLRLTSPEFNDDWYDRIQMKKPFQRFWTPIDCYFDIICFLIPKMSEYQIAELLDNNVSNNSYLLKYFLNWPYQHCFMKIVSLTWKCLDKYVYCDILRMISSKIDTQQVREPTYGEEKNYDYRGLLKEFWCVNPEDFKRYVFSAKTSPLTFYRNSLMYRPENHPFIAEFLSTLLKLKYFTYREGELIRLIIESATDVEKENIFFSWDEFTEYWVKFMKQESWEVFYRLVLYCFVNKEEADKFKRKFISTVSVHNTCVDFLKRKNYSALHSFIEWIGLPEEIKELKRAVGCSDAAKKAYIDLAVEDNWKEIEAICNWCLSEDERNKVKLGAIYSKNGKHFCREMCFRYGGEKAKQFCSYFLSSEEEIINFRKELVSVNWSDDIEDCIDLLDDYGAGFVSDFFNFCILPKNYMKILKNKIYSRLGKDPCKLLCLTEGIGRAMTFCEAFFTTEEDRKKFRKELIFIEGFNAKDFVNLRKKYGIEAISDLLNFCLISEEKLKELKECVGSVYGEKICKSLITLDDSFRISRSRWEDVEEFLTWCFSSEEDIRNFKKNFLLSKSGTFIHGTLIMCNEWVEAQTFFSWLELSNEEIFQLKKTTLCDELIFKNLRRHLRDKRKISMYGGKEGAMELFLMWFINDKDVDPELMHRLKCMFQTDDKEDDFIKFEILMEQHLKSLGNEKVCMKRKNRKTYLKTKNFAFAKT